MNVQDETVAKVHKIKRWSPVWIVPIVTALIGIWIIFYHFSHKGPEVTLIAKSAEGLEAGKTAIKNRSVDVGVVDSVTLGKDLNTVVIKARLNSGMSKLLRKDSVFWVVKPTIGRNGVSGLGTLLSGSYIGLQMGKSTEEENEFTLSDQPPLAPPDAKGLRVLLISEKAGQLNAGDPVLFHGLKVGSVETSNFDPKTRQIHYQLFINSPYDKLVTSNVRFWVDSGIAFDMTPEGMRLEMGSIATVLGGGVSFDVPDGWAIGEQANKLDKYKLFESERKIQESLYTQHIDMVMFFSDSVRGLQEGAPVEFRGIRLGTVAQVPYFIKELKKIIGTDFLIPVLVHIEPERLEKKLGVNFDIENRLLSSIKNGLRASLKSANLLTGALYVDIDFYPNAKPWTGPSIANGIRIMPTVSGGLTQLQQKLNTILDKVNKLPLEPLMTQATQTLKSTDATVKQTQRTMDTFNKMLSSKEAQMLPADMQKTLLELNKVLQGVQPGSPAYNKMVGDMQHLEQVLREMQPVLRTLNNKSNALIFAAPAAKDPQPKGAK